MHETTVGNLADGLQQCSGEGIQMRTKQLLAALIAGGVFSLPLLGVGQASAAAVPGTGTNSAINLYWGHKPPSSFSYVWNNSGTETARLENAAGKTVDYRTYVGRSVSGPAYVIYGP